jgi:GTP-binding protein
MKPFHYNRIAFLKSAHKTEQLPPDIGAEVALAGRSNAGKSSALNAITGFKRLAKTSKTPGKTQHINFFQLDPQRRLVDLPGYGYAKVPDAIKFHWEKMLSEYITQRKSLKGIVLLMDIRHPLQPLDWQMIGWTLAHKLPLHILLTKADKLKKGAAIDALLTIQKELSGREYCIKTQLFSAFTGQGIEEVRQKLDDWLEIAHHEGNILKE